MTQLQTYDWNALLAYHGVGLVGGKQPVQVQETTLLLSSKQLALVEHLQQSPQALTSEDSVGLLVRAGYPTQTAEHWVKQLTQYAEAKPKKGMSQAALGLYRLPLWSPSESVTTWWKGRVVTPINVAAYLLLLLASFVALASALPAYRTNLPAVVSAFEAWPLLWVAMLLTTALHEFGHFVVAAHHGVRSRTVGLSLLYLGLAGYVDVSNAWLTSRRVRIQIALGGIAFQLIPAGLAMLAMLHTPHPLLLLYVISNLVSALFNLIPFVRLDGYWVLSHALDYPNLRERSFATLIRQSTTQESLFRTVSLCLYAVVSMLVTILFYGAASHGVARFLPEGFGLPLFALFTLFGLFALVREIQSSLQRRNQHAR